jgi:prepilin-type processing-associated H-X9-DG protein
MISSQHRKQLRSTGTARTQDRSGAGLAEVLITITILVLLAAFFLPSIRRGPEVAHRAQCKNNLKLIGLALHNYVEDQGALPPAYTVDANGQPLHSWRTLILPYLDQKPLYDRIDLSKPWNDPANAEAYSTTIHYYVCPSATLPEGHTTCLAMVGPENSFHSTETRVFRDFTDGTSNTVWVIDASPPEAVHWMDPRSSANRFFLTFNDESELSHSGGIHAAFADGSIRFLTNGLPTATRRALATIAGGEDISGDF